MTLKHVLAAVAMTFAVSTAANAAQPEMTASQDSAQAPTVVTTARQPTKQKVEGEGGSAALNRFTRTGRAEQ